LRCPFGCREHHRYIQSQYRSWKYRQTDCGKEKKAELNKKRDRISVNNAEKGNQLNEDHKDIAVHIRFVMQLLFHRYISWNEIFKILDIFFNKWRQRSLYTCIDSG